MNAAEILALAPALLADDAGQGMVEYALIIALLALSALGVLTTLGKSVANTLSKANTSLS